MFTNHEALHMAYTLGLKAVTGKLSPAYRQQWEVATRHIPAKQMECALNSFGIRIGAHSVTVPMKHYADTISREKIVFVGADSHYTEYMNVIRRG